LVHALNRGNDRKTLFDVFKDFEDFLGHLLMRCHAILTPSVMYEKVTTMR